MLVSDCDDAFAVTVTPEWLLNGNVKRSVVRVMWQDYKPVFATIPKSQEDSRSGRSSNSDYYKPMGQSSVYDRYGDPSGMAMHAPPLRDGITRCVCNKCTSCIIIIEIIWDKYADLPASYIFQPIALETLGPMNSSAMEFFTVLGRKIGVSSGDDWEGRFLFQRLSISAALHRNFAARKFRKESTIRTS